MAPVGGHRGAAACLVALAAFVAVLLQPVDCAVSRYRHYGHNFRWTTDPADATGNVRIVGRTAFDVNTLDGNAGPGFSFYDRSKLPPGPNGNVPPIPVGDPTAQIPVSSTSGDNRDMICRYGASTTQYPQQKIQLEWESIDPAGTLLVPLITQMNPINVCEYKSTVPTLVPTTLEVFYNMSTVRTNQLAASTTARNWIPGGNVNQITSVVPWVSTGFTQASGDFSTPQGKFKIDRTGAVPDPAGHLLQMPGTTLDFVVGLPNVYRVTPIHPDLDGYTCELVIGDSAVPPVCSATGAPDDNNIPAMFTAQAAEANSVTVCSAPYWYQDDANGGSTASFLTLDPTNPCDLVWDMSAVGGVQPGAVDPIQGAAFWVQLKLTTTRTGCVPGACTSYTTTDFRIRVLPAATPAGSNLGPWTGTFNSPNAAVGPMDERTGLPKFRVFKNKPVIMSQQAGPWNIIEGLTDPYAMRLSATIPTGTDFVPSYSKIMYFVNSLWMPGSTAAPPATDPDTGAPSGGAWSSFPGRPVNWAWFFDDGAGGPVISIFPPPAPGKGAWGRLQGFAGNLLNEQPAAVGVAALVTSYGAPGFRRLLAPVGKVNEQRASPNNFPIPATLNRVPDYWYLGNQFFYFDMFAFTPDQSMVDAKVEAGVVQFTQGTDTANFGLLDVDAPRTGKTLTFVFEDEIAQPFAGGTVGWKSGLSQVNLLNGATYKSVFGSGQVAAWTNVHFLAQFNWAASAYPSDINWCPWTLAAGAGTPPPEWAYTMLLTSLAGTITLENAVTTNTVFDPRPAACTGLTGNTPVNKFRSHVEQTPFSTGSSVSAFGVTLATPVGVTAPSAYRIDAVNTWFPQVAAAKKAGLPIPFAGQIVADTTDAWETGSAVASTHLILDVQLPMDATTGKPLTPYVDNSHRILAIDPDADGYTCSMVLGAAAGLDSSAFVSVDLTTCVLAIDVPSIVEHTYSLGKATGNVHKLSGDNPPRASPNDGVSLTGFDNIYNLPAGFHWVRFQTAAQAGYFTDVLDDPTDPMRSSLWTNSRGVGYDAGGSFLYCFQVALKTTRSKTNVGGASQSQSLYDICARVTLLVRPDVGVMQPVVHTFNTEVLNTATGVYVESVPYTDVETASILLFPPQPATDDSSAAASGAPKYIAYAGRPLQFLFYLQNRAIQDGVAWIDTAGGPKATIKPYAGIKYYDASPSVAGEIFDSTCTLPLTIGAAESTPWTFNGGASVYQRLYACYFKQFTQADVGEVVGHVVGAAVKTTIAPNFQPITLAQPAFADLSLWEPVYPLFGTLPITIKVYDATYEASATSWYRNSPAVSTVQFLHRSTYDAVATYGVDGSTDVGTWDFAQGIALFGFLNGSPNPNSLVGATTSTPMNFTCSNAAVAKPAALARGQTLNVYTDGSGTMHCEFYSPYVDITPFFVSGPLSGVATFDWRAARPDSVRRQDVDLPNFNSGIRRQIAAEATRMAVNTVDRALLVTDATNDPFGDWGMPLTYQGSIKVDLRDPLDYGGPIISVPPLIQVPNSGLIETISLLGLDPDQDGYTCALSSSAINFHDRSSRINGLLNSGLVELANTGTPLPGIFMPFATSTNCNLRIDLTNPANGFATGQIYSFQVLVKTTRKSPGGVELVTTSVLDSSIQLVDYDTTQTKVTGSNFKPIVAVSASSPSLTSSTPTPSNGYPLFTASQGTDFAYSVTFKLPALNSATVTATNLRLNNYQYIDLDVYMNKYVGCVLPGTVQPPPPALQKPVCPYTITDLDAKTKLFTYRRAVANDDIKSWAAGWLEFCYDLYDTNGTPITTDDTQETYCTMQQITVMFKSVAALSPPPPPPSPPPSPPPGVPVVVPTGALASGVQVPPNQQDAVSVTYTINAGATITANFMVLSTAGSGMPVQFVNQQGFGPGTTVSQVVGYVGAPINIAFTTPTYPTDVGKTFTGVWQFQDKTNGNIISYTINVVVTAPAAPPPPPAALTLTVTPSTGSAVPVVGAGGQTVTFNVQPGTLTNFTTLATSSVASNSVQIVSYSGLPAGATCTPAAGTTGTGFVSFVCTFTPSAVGTYTATATVGIPNGASVNQTITWVVAISSPPPSPSPSPPPPPPPSPSPPPSVVTTIDVAENFARVNGQAVPPGPTSGGKVRKVTLQPGNVFTYSVKFFSKPGNGKVKYDGFKKMPPGFKCDKTKGDEAQDSFNLLCTYTAPADAAGKSWKRGKIIGSANNGQSVKKQPVQITVEKPQVKTVLSVSNYYGDGASGVLQAQKFSPVVWWNASNVEEVRRTLPTGPLEVLFPPKCAKCGQCSHAWRPLIEAGKARVLLVAFMQPSQVSKIYIREVNAPNVVKVELVKWPLKPTAITIADLDRVTVATFTDAKPDPTPCPGTLTVSIPDAISGVTQPVPDTGSQTNLGNLKAYSAILVYVKEGLVKDKTTYIDFVQFDGRILYPAPGTPEDNSRVDTVATSITLRRAL